MKNLLLVLFIFISANSIAQLKPFRFAFISDTHIGSPNGSAEEDLRRTVRDINAMNDIDFVVLTGDITELGTKAELLLAKDILDSLDVPWYIIPGNHDTGWSESGGDMFSSIFGYDKFSFEHKGIVFLGCPSGPYVRMSDGHVPRDAVNWLDVKLKTLKKDQPVIFLNHYPMDNALDNWYEITDRLRNHNTLAILCGHGHANKALNFEDIPGVMGRSNLRARSAVGGYNLVDVTTDSIIFNEKKPGTTPANRWTAVGILKTRYDKAKKFPRPDYTINSEYPQVKRAWTYSSAANIISTPAIGSGRVYVGNQKGEMTCFDQKNGKVVWKKRTGGAIFSSPAVSGNRVIFGSGDGGVYCLDTKNGKLKWKTQTNAAVLGSPIVQDNVVYIGGSDGIFRAIDIVTGMEVWTFSGLEGPVVSTPLTYDGKVIFGAWDRNLYALNLENGNLEWKWNNGSSVRNYSPAACIPVAMNGVIYIVAPDRYISAIDVKSGKTLWRNNDATVRESIGISENGDYVYGKTMQDTIVAYKTSESKQPAAWKMHVGFGYEHVPSMLIEKDGRVFFGTKNGVVYCIDPQARKIVWAHKIDNSMVNTVRVIDKNTVVVSTMDGKLVMLNN